MSDTWTLRKTIDPYPAGSETYERFYSGKAIVRDNVVVVHKPQWRDELLYFRGYSLIEDEDEAQVGEEQSPPPAPKASSATKKQTNTKKTKE